MRCPLLCCVASFTLALPSALAQDAPAPPQNSSHTASITVSSRLVVEDVTVIDSKGQPVAGLPASAFHVFDNGVARSDFEVREQDATLAAPVPTPADVHTNQGVVRSPGTLAVLLVDPISVELTDQLFLRVQLMRFLQNLRPGASAAVFRTNSQGIPVELQSPTTDRALLRQALEQVVPIIPRPFDNKFEVAATSIENLAEILRYYPGNKAVLWLAGAFPLFVPTQYSLDSNDRSREEARRREVERALQQARVALYPIDVRGVVQGGFAPVRALTGAGQDALANDPSQGPRTLTSESQKIGGQYDAMDAIALATGGFAFYSNNAVARVMDSALTLAQHAYTLSLRPLPTDNGDHRHTLRITVDGPYTAHYRTGYFDDMRSPGSTDAPPEQRRRLAAAGGSSVLAAEATLRDPALQFAARVLPGEPQGKKQTVRIRYVIPHAELLFTDSTGAQQSRFRLTALAYNSSGDILGHASDVVETHYTAQQDQLAARIGVPADQSVTLDKGARYLLLAVEDLQTEKVGTVQLQLSTVPQITAASAAAH